MSTSQIELKTLVVKIGTSLLTSERGFDGQVLEEIVKEVAHLKRERLLNIIIVSSGAIGCGMNVLGLKQRPRELPLKQATAAVGQSTLMHYYETLFRTYGDGLNTAQVLLSTHDLDDRQSYLNVRNTIRALFDLKTVVPVVNENDSVATEELRFGDNDTLAARVAAKIDADLLVILSNVDGLCDKDPTKHTDAKLIDHVAAFTPDLEALAGDTRQETSTGGMVTKLVAARMAWMSGVPSVIANGRRPEILHAVLAGEGPATYFGRAGTAMSHKKRWIAFGRTARGVIQIDEGARRALLEQGKSLLPAGVTAVTGTFDIGAAVRIADSSGRNLACGLVNYSSADIGRIKGCKTREIEAILGHKDFDEVVHRNNLVVL